MFCHIIQPGLGGWNSCGNFLPLCLQQPQQQQQHPAGASVSPAKGGARDWDDIDLGSPQP